MTTNLTYEQRERYACKVCGNVPDQDGILAHGRGCYVISEDGGGEEFVEMKAMESDMTTGDAGKVIGVPELPYGWNEIIAQSNLSAEGARWMFGLVHAVYDANGLKQQLSDLQQRVMEIQDAIKQLVLAGDEHHAMTDCEGWCRWQLAKVVAEKLFSD